jgi:hypothetical protein
VNKPQQFMNFKQLNRLICHATEIDSRQIGFVDTISLIAPQPLKIVDFNQRLSIQLPIIVVSASAFDSASAFRNISGV